MKWTKQIEELSNNVYKLTLTHSLGPQIIKTGSNLKQLESEAKIDSQKLDNQIKEKLNKN